MLKLPAVPSSSSSSRFCCSSKAIGPCEAGVLFGRPPFVFQVIAPNVKYLPVNRRLWIQSWVVIQGLLFGVARSRPAYETAHGGVVWCKDAMAVDLGW